MGELVPVSNNASLEVDDAGSGSAVVLLHGWPVTARHWDRVLPALLAAGHRTISVSLRGMGGSSTGPGDFAKATLAAEILSLLERLEVKEYALIGHDWGATVAYLVAAQAGACARALVVEEEILPGVDLELPSPGLEHYPDWHAPFLRSPGLAEDLLPGREDSFYRHFLIDSAGPQGLDPALLEHYVRAYVVPGQLRRSADLYRARNSDVLAVQAAARARMSLPVLAIGGEFGMGPAVATGMRSLVRSVEEMNITATGHYPATQAPREFATAVTSFLAAF